MTKFHTTKSERAYARRLGNSFSRAVSTSLLIVTFLLPVGPLFANEQEIIEAQTETVEPITTDITDQTVLTSVEGEIILEEALLEQSEPNVEFEERTTQETTTSSTNYETEVQQENVAVLVNELNSSTTILNNVVVSTSSTEIEISTSTPYATSTNTDTIFNSATTSDDEIVSPNTENEELEEVTAPPESVNEDTANIEAIEDEDGDVVPEPQVAMNVFMNDEHKFSFGKNECVLTGDETYYCTKAQEDPIKIDSDQVYSAQDADGDMEIYVQKNGTITQITNNTVDDTAPYYDALTQTIVWHALIDGRYQIFSYDFAEEKITQITHDRYNNMEPHKFGNSLVWQGWVGNDWEIFLLEGDTLTMITDNTVEDITPSVNGNHIVWQSFEDGAWKMKVYDIRTKVVQTIQSSDGGSIDNPRFVLVYDTKYDTGDIETRGYDLESGEVVPLGVTPSQEPIDIPDPEELPEEKALINTSTQLKPKMDGEDDFDDDTTTLDTNPDTETENEVLESDLIIPPLVSESENASSTETAEEVGSSEYDLVISPAEPIVSTSTNDIPDVVIMRQE